ncbi:rhodanese-like domain-containing protein [Shewanella sp. FJAT-52076]|nr:rhodanese-like domain-containing protein [Shewanella sp. FJAT-52076]QYJ73979.1 rhodanese-like domain-containing protein [Shewanella sp. FJAT-52076]
MNPLAKIGQLALIGLMLMLTSTLAIGQDKDAATAWKLIEQGAMLVDVRTPEEYAAGHIEGAINIPYEEVAAEFAKRAIDKDTSVVLYCRSGRRSGVANDALNAAGFTQVYNGGGYENLAQSGKSEQSQK